MLIISNDFRYKDTYDIPIQFFQFEINLLIIKRYSLLYYDLQDRKNLLREQYYC